MIIFKFVTDPTRKQSSLKNNQYPGASVVYNMNQDKIKLIIASNIMHIGGAERTVQTLALNLDKEIFDVTVLCMEDGGGRVEELLRGGVKVLIGNGAIEKIKELIPEPDVDILHFHRSGHKEGLHIEVLEYLRPKKVMETNVFAFDDDVLGAKFNLRVYKSMMMLTQRAWKNRVIKKDWWKKERVIYNPVTLDKFNAYKLDKEVIQEKRRALGIDDNNIVIGRVGRNDPVKWGDLILAALPYIKKGLPNVKIIFRTAPVNRLGWLKYKGYLGKNVIVLPETNNEKEISETYQLLDIYVHTTRRGEAFGNTLNEAMAWELPIIVENTPHWDNGQLEQVKNDVNGFVIQSVGGLMAALKKLVEDKVERARLGSNGRKRVENNFGQNIGIEQYELAYKNLMGMISEAELQKDIFPSIEEVESYAREYGKLKRVDYPHELSALAELRFFKDKLKWRLYDSLVARGFLKKPKL